MSKPTLYPLKFQPIFKEKIWGGQKIKTILGKDLPSLANCGETWELSGAEGNISRVANGELQGKGLDEIIKLYGGELLGTQVVKSNDEFPLLIKFLDANDDLSIQVHPDDDLAHSRHGSLGKTEMWYVLQADPGSSLITGFNQPISQEEYLEHLENGTLTQILNIEKVEQGDVFFIPAGRVHTIGKGLLIAEIQQTSDITYRIYDFDRTDQEGNKRELHSELAIDAIDYSFYNEYKTNYSAHSNGSTKVVSSKYFETNILNLTSEYTLLGSSETFRILIGVEGEASVDYKGDIYSLAKGDVILLPAIIESVVISPMKEARILETYIPFDN